jgi:hypothetical protein
MEPTDGPPPEESPAEEVPVGLPEAPSEPGLDRAGPRLPNAVGLDEASARRALAAWQVTVERTLSVPAYVGKVVNQFPYPGENLAPGQPLTIVTALERMPSLEHLSVPMAEGKPWQEAQAVVEQFGLRASFRIVPAQGAPHGTIVSQSPLPGSITTRGGEVILRVAKGVPGGETPTPPSEMVPPTEPVVPSTEPVFPPTEPVSPTEPTPPTEPVPPTEPTPPEEPLPPPPPVPVPVELAIPNLLSPRDGDAFPRAYGATFQWHKVTNAESYDWELEEEKAGKWVPVTSQTFVETRWRPERMERGRFRWRVRACSGEFKGEWSPWARLFMY